MNDTEAIFDKAVTRMEFAWEEVSLKWSGGGRTRPERKSHAIALRHGRTCEARSSKARLRARTRQ